MTRKLVWFEMWTKILFKRQGISVPSTILGKDGRRYTVQEQLGAGGNAVVCECEDAIDGTVYAVKFLTSQGDDARLPRFQLETALLERLSQKKHDHLIRFVTSGVAIGERFDTRKRKAVSLELPFVVMEKANCSLRQHVKNSTDPIPPEIYVAQFRGLVGALELLHSQAIHRDIKPDNILVVGDRWQISDLGLCAMLEDGDGEDLTEAWRVVGPRFWMSPEANNVSVGLPDEIGIESDIFQLAAVFWWVVNRRHPSGILIKDDWSGIEELFEPISKALQHSLARRYASASEFGHAVNQAISS